MNLIQFKSVLMSLPEMVVFEPELFGGGLTFWFRGDTASVQSFLHTAKQQGLTVTAVSGSTISVEEANIVPNQAWLMTRGKAIATLFQQFGVANIDLQHETKLVS